MNGILIVDKPSGMTSHDVVARCRRTLGERKIGHAGTLDPDATGVLVLGIGRATRLLQFLEAQAKTYLTTMVLGVRTSTLDGAGEITDTTDASGVGSKDLEAVLERFRGEIEQIPPMVSAIKVDGERLYAKARRGETIERASRRVTIDELTLESFRPPTLRVRCSKGTYIRTLVADIGDALGVGAHVATLRRIASGPYEESAAVDLDRVSQEAIVSLKESVSGFQRRDLDAGEALAVVQGKRLPSAGIQGVYAVFSGDTLVGMAHDVGQVMKTMCVLVEAAEVAT